jgi:REP-associated tyrosine transposase
MNSHVHLFLEPSSKISLPKTMQLINWKYANDFNRLNGRKGHFWMQRYQCIPVESDRYALALMRYINRNPIRAGMVENAGEWRWSGYGFYGNGASNELLTFHPSYLATGATDEKRRASYQEFVNAVLPSEDRRDPRFSESLYIGSETFERET